MKKLILLTGLVLGIAQISYSSVYNILDFGARNNSTESSTVQIQSAIDRCAASGGGVVYVPGGEYLTGTLNLRSNVDFHLESGAVLKATTDLKKYQKHNEHIAGVFYTEDADHVSITGNGTIFGQGMEFMYRDSAKVIRGDVNRYIRQGYDFRKVSQGLGDGPVMPGERYHQMIIFSNCTNVALRDFHVVDAPYWTFLIVHCDGVSVSGLTINNNLLIPNSDGLDIISSSNVNVTGCNISCGDDAIVLAGYAHHFGDPGFRDIMRTSSSINISDCVLRSRSSAIRIGGWDQNSMSGYNFSNIIIYDSNCGINITVRDSGSVRNVSFSNIRIETRMHTGDWWGNGEPVKITAMRGVRDDRIGDIRNIFFDNITCIGENAILLYASDETRLENISFSNFDFILRESALGNVSGGNFDLRPNIIPGKEIFASDIPVIYIRNAENVRFNQGTIGWGKVKEKYYSNAVEAVKVKGLRFANVIASSSPSNPGLPTISAKDCTNPARVKIR